MALVVLAAALQAGGEETLDPLLATLKLRFHELFGEHQTSTRIGIPEGCGGKSLLLRFKTRTYQVHPSNKAGVDR